MIPTRRAVLAASLLAPITARAQGSYPMRPFRLIVSFAPGGPSDTLAERLSTSLGQRLVVENRSGAGSTIGADAVAKAPPDGYTLLFNNVSHATNRSLFRRLPFDPAADFAPVALLAESPIILLGGPNLPAADLPAFLALVRASPGRYDYGLAGNGMAAHLAVAKLLAAAGLSTTHIPYRGVAPATHAPRRHLCPPSAPGAENPHGRHQGRTDARLSDLGREQHRRRRWRERKTEDQTSSVT